jgi:hypothetical protein
MNARPPVAPLGGGGERVLDAWGEGGVDGVGGPLLSSERVALYEPDRAVYAHFGVEPPERRSPSPAPAPAPPGRSGRAPGSRGRRRPRSSRCRPEGGARSRSLCSECPPRSGGSVAPADNGTFSGHSAAASTSSERKRATTRSSGCVPPRSSPEIAGRTGPLLRRTLQSFALLRTDSRGSASWSPPPPRTGATAPLGRTGRAPRSPRRTRARSAAGRRPPAAPGGSACGIGPTHCAARPVDAVRRICIAWMRDAGRRPASSAVKSPRVGRSRGARSS